MRIRLPQVGDRYLTYTLGPVLAAVLVFVSVTTRHTQQAAGTGPAI